MKKKKSLINLIFILSILAIGCSNYPQNAMAERNKLAMEENESQNRELNLLKKIPIESNVGTLLTSLVERVWVTNYYNTPSEIYGSFGNTPICTEFPNDKNIKRSTTPVSSSFIWLHKCSPVEVIIKSSSENSDLVATVRMLDSGISSKILKDVSQIIQEDALGRYKIEDERKQEIKSIIQKKHGPVSKYSPINYRNALKTYSNLEGYYFLDKTSSADTEATKDPEDIREYLSRLGKKYLLSFQYDVNVFKKKGNVIEFNLILSQARVRDNH